MPRNGRKITLIVILLLSAVFCGFSVSAHAAEGDADPTPNQEGQKTVDISFTARYFFPGTSTEATVTATGDEDEEFDVTLSGPGTITPSHLSLVSGVSQTVQITLPTAVQHATYKATLDDSDPEIKDEETVDTVTATVTSQYDSVAAGAIGTAVHQSEITVTVKDVDGNAAVGMAIPDPKITAGGLGPDDGEPTADVAWTPGTVTDGSGTAKGTFTSGNRTESTTVSVAGAGSVSIGQGWNKLAGSDDAWTYPPTFDFDVVDTITYHMRIDRGSGDEAIDGHGLDWVTTGIGGYEWKEGIGEDWTGPNGEPDGIPDGDYEGADYSDEDADPTGFDTWKGLSEFSGAGGGGGGDYTAQQTIHYDWDFIVDNVWFDVIDDNVFDAD